MKKIFLVTILLFQLTFVFGQSVMSENNESILYNQVFGPWETAPGYNNILFSAGLKWYDKKTNFYAWDVRMKSTRTPVDFEFKITNQVFTGGGDYGKAVEENDGYYKTGIFDKKSSDKRASGSGFTVHSKSKTHLYFTVRNVCFDFDGREPICDKKKTTVKQGTTKQPIGEQNSNNVKSISKSVEELENIILSNLRNHLKKGSFFHNSYYQGKQRCDLAGLQFDKEATNYWGGFNPEPHKLYILFNINNNSELIHQKFSDLLIERSQNLLKFERRQNSNIFDYLLYDFGPNDENYIELQNAIEALKNPNYKIDALTKQTANVQKAQVTNSQNKEQSNKSVKENTFSDKTLKNEISAEEGQEIISATRSKDVPQATQNIINIFTSLGYKYIKTTIGDNEHYPNEVTIDFANNFIISLNPVTGTSYGVIISIHGNKNKLVNQLNPIFPYLNVSETVDFVQINGFKKRE